MYMRIHALLLSNIFFIPVWSLIERRQLTSYSRNNAAYIYELQEYSLPNVTAGAHTRFKSNFAESCRRAREMKVDL